MQKIYCWKLFSLLVVLKVSINRDNQAWPVKQLTRVSSFKMWSFPFSLLSQSHRHLWAPVVCNTWWQTLQNICEHHEKNYPQTKKPGHSLTDHMLPKFRCPDSITIWCRSGNTTQSQGGQSTSLAPSHGHRLKGKASYHKGKTERFSLFLCSIGAHLWVCVYRGLEIRASSISCIAENDKVTLVQNTLWTNWEKPFLIIYNFNILQGKEDREILSVCTDDDHLSCTSCSQRAKDKQALPLPLPTTPVTEVPKLNVDPRLLTTQDYECPNDNCRPLLHAQQQAYRSSI